MRGVGTENAEPSAQQGRREALEAAKAAAAEGDPAAMLSALYESSILDGLVRHLEDSSPELDAHDLVSQAVDVLYEKVSGGERVLNVAAFLVKVVRDRRADVLRSVRRHEDAVAALGHDAEVDANAGESDGDERREMRKEAVAIARQVVNKLGRGNIVPVMSYLIEAVAQERPDVSVEDLAEEFDLRQETVRVLLHRGFQRLEKEARLLRLGLAPPPPARGRGAMRNDIERSRLRRAEDQGDDT